MMHAFPVSPAADIKAEVAPDRLDMHEATAVRAAAHRATKLWPGAIGELVSRELYAHASFGYRADQTGLMPQVVRAVMATPMPTPVES